MTLRSLAVALSLALGAVPLAALAQNTSGQRNLVPPGPAASGVPVTTTVVAASDVVGRTARDMHGDDVGAVDFLVISPRSGAVVYIVLGSDPAVDLGGQFIAIPWSAAVGTGNPPWGGDTLLLNMTADQVRQGLHLGENELAKLLRPTYGPQPSPAEPALLVGRGSVLSLLPNRLEGIGNLREAEVRAPNGQFVGRIDQVMIDALRGKVAYLLVAEHEYLGLGGQWLPVPVEALAWSPAGGNFVLSTDPRMARIPTLPKQPLPSHVSSQQLAALYRAYGLAPYWQVSQAPILGRSGTSVPAGYGASAPPSR